MPDSRQAALQADLDDPLRAFRDEFDIDLGGPIYLDGNSLGRPPRATAAAVASVLDEWRRQLVSGWDRWIDLPRLVGDRIGRLLGAANGQVVLSDSTTVNLYKLAAGALGARPTKGAIVGDLHDFPTVRYVLQGLAERERRRLVLVESDPVEGPSPEQVGAALERADDVALCCFSAVNYRSGALLDVAAVTEAAHRVGALTLFDLSHAAGVVPVGLDAADVDLATGCSYKYLNGGPGAPAWLYVRRDVQPQLRQPIWGWFGQRDQFAMARDYDPVEGIERFLTGSPAILGIAAVDAGIAPLLAAGMPEVWAKARRLVALLARRSEERLVPRGVSIASPGDPARRGGHLALAHPQALAASRLLVERGLVVPDFRRPDVLRLAPVALSTSYVEVWDAVERVAEVLDDGAVHRVVAAGRIT